MKKRTKSKIPSFKNYEEEAKFWETHAVTDFEDETRDVDMVFELDGKKEEAIVMRIQESMKRKLEKVAKKKGVSVSVLSRTWLAEKLRTSI